MMRSSTIMSALGVLALALTAVPAAAYDGYDPDESQCPPFTRYVPENAETESFPVYVAVDQILTMHGIHTWSVWIYAESNDVEGLQRFDGFCTNAGAENGDAYRDIHDMIVF